MVRVCGSRVLTCWLVGVRRDLFYVGDHLFDDLGSDVAAAETGWRDAIYYHYYESQAVHMVPAMYGVRTERFKLVRYYEPQWDTWEMFDLETDPSEMHNIAEEPRYAAMRKYLEKMLAELREQYGDDTGQVGAVKSPSEPT